MRLRLILIGLTLLGSFALASGAAAEVRTGTVEFYAPENGPSFEPQPPATQQDKYIDTVTASYDTGGTLTFRMRLFDYAHWSDEILPQVFMLGTTCDDWDEDRILSGGWDRDWATGENDQRVYYNYAGIERRGYTGSTSGVVTWDGQWFTITFSHTALASLNLRCVGIANEGFEGEEYFYFDGYEPFVVTAASATREWKSYLARTRGFKSGWAKCPREEVFSLDKGRPKQAICMAQYKVGKTWRFYTGTVSVKAEQPSVKSDFSRKWVRRWHSCRKPRWARDLKGRLRSNYGCDFLMAGDADYLLRNGERVRSTFWHGTNTAGFQTVARFRCRHLSKRAVTCRNRLGDAFRYSRGQPRG